MSDKTRCENLIERYELLEMANLAKGDHGLDIDVKFHILQLGTDSKGNPKQVGKHGPRIKVFKNFIDDGFTVALNKDLKVTGNYEKVIKRRELNNILKHIEINLDNYLKFWSDRAMAVSELKDLLK